MPFINLYKQTMQKEILSLAAVCLIFSAEGQFPDHPEKRDFGLEMEKSEEHAPNPEVQLYPNDYSSYKRTKAWNKKAITSGGFLRETTELDFYKIGGRTRATLADKDNNIYLAAPSGGGLWKFAPDGSSFTPIDDLGNFMPITDINQNPFDKTQIVIGTGDEIHGIPGFGAFISNDGGNSFSPIASTDPESNSEYRYIRFIKYSPQTPNTLYMAIGNDLMRSTNGGGTWTKVFDGPSKIRSLEFKSGTGIVLAVNNNGIYTSPNGNDGSFTLSTSGISSGSDATNPVVASHAANRDIMYAMIEKSSALRVFKSTNGGASWSETTAPVFSTMGQGWFSIAIGVHPTDPNIVLIGNISFGYSVDGGSTWLNARGFEVDYHDIRFHESDPNVAYIGYDQGFGTLDLNNTSMQWGIAYNPGDGSFFWESQLQGEQFEIGKNPGFNTMQVYFGDYYPESYGDSYIAGYQDGGVMAQISGHTDWRPMAGDGGSVLINKQTPNKGFISTQYGRLFFSNSADVPVSNAFSEVKATDYSTSFYTSFAGNNADGNQIYFATPSQVQRSGSDGATWTNIASHSLSSAKVATEHAVNPVVYCVGRNGSSTDIISISNAATSPSSLTNSFDYSTLGIPDRLNVDPNNRNSLYMTSTWGDAFKITGLNSGSATYADIKGDFPDVTFNTVIGFDGYPDILMAGTNIGLFYSADAGSSWTLTDEIPHAQVTDLKFRESDNRLFVFTYGRGSWATTLDFLSVGSEEVKLTNFSVYPNPANNLISIDTKEELRVSIFDQKGSRVINSTSKSIDVSSLSAGLYMIHLENNEGLVGTEKFIIK